VNLPKRIPSNVEKVLDKGKRKLKLDEEHQDVVHKALINVVELEKNMLRLNKLEAHLAPRLMVWLRR